MKLSELEMLELTRTADFHVHLRQSAMMELVTPLIRPGGADLVYVMPNLQPPISTVKEAEEYHAKLQALAPDVTFLMSLFLSPKVTVEDVKDLGRGKSVVWGVKYYPAGVTTNSQSGVQDIEQYYPVFAEMEKNGLILNLHGEAISTPPSAYAKNSDAPAITIMNAEPMFLPQLEKLHRTFPKLKIVLEHVSTREGLEAVKRCGPTVAGTITAHHLWTTIEDACGDVFSFCKPVAKTPEDRIALVRAVVENSGKFFFGSDSAPHPLTSKHVTGRTAAGCFTQPYTTTLVFGALEEGVKQGWIREEDVTVDSLEAFLGGTGRRFYGVEKMGGGEGGEGGEGKLGERRIRLVRKGEKIVDFVKGKGEDGEKEGIKVVPFARGRQVWSVEWV